MDNASTSLPCVQQTSGLAIASLVLSCLSLFLGLLLGPFGCVPGIVCGHLARWQIRKHPQVSGDGVALAGLIVGYTLFSLFAIAFLLVYSLDVVPSSTTVVRPL
jgi:hypothetical protein